MKKTILLLGLISSVAFTSCGGDKKEEEKESKTNSEDRNADGKLSAADATDEMWEDGLKKCIDAAKQSMGAAADSFDKDKLSEAVEDYCSCSMDKMKEADMSVSDMYNQAKVMEVAADCITDFQNDIKELMTQN